MRHKLVELLVVIDEAFSDLELDYKEFNLSVLKRQATDIYRELATTEQLVQKIVLLETNAQGKIEIPNDLKKVEHIAYRIKKDKHDCTRRETVKEWVQKAYNCSEEEFDVKIDVFGDQCLDDKCSSQPIVIDVDFAWQKSNPFYYDQSKMAVPRNSTEDIYRNSSYLSDKFTLLGYTGNPFFRLKYQVESCPNLSCIGCKYHYSYEWPFILTDLPKETEVLISYLGEVTDEKGDIMIPDHPDVLEAIKESLIAKHSRIMFLQTDNKKWEYFWKDAEAKSNAAIGRAKSAIGTPPNQEMRTFFTNVWSRRVRNSSEIGSISGRDPYQAHLK